jgi:malonyl-CoA O-methyltransferase
LNEHNVSLNDVLRFRNMFRSSPAITGKRIVKAALSRIGLASFVGTNGASTPDASHSAPRRALNWVRTSELPTGGIRVHSKHPYAYPEVSGYLVPTLLQYGERTLAKRLLRWLCNIQRANGSFTDPDHGCPYIFDSGQVLRGLLAGVALGPTVRDAARRVADYLCAQMVEGGKGGFGPRYGSEGNPPVPETVHLYALPPLVQAAEVLGNPEYRAAAQRCLDYYCAHKDFLNIGSLTHFLGYELDALIDLGRADLASPKLKELRSLQAADGSVRGQGGVPWVCSPGLAQIAICWYKTAQSEPADKALAWLEGVQRPSGGFLGSYGPAAAYLGDAELSWAAKFYLDAHLSRVQSFFVRWADECRSSVRPDDGRARAVLAVVRPDSRVLEVGCGKGRFLKVIREAYPTAECCGVDIAPGLLAHVPNDIQAKVGSLESIPFPDASFDVVFSVEAIEHSANPEAAVAEMIRVARPGAWVVVIDKQLSQWGRASCPSWERWPEKSELRKLLNRACDQVTAETIAYENKSESDGLMVAWKGQKRSRISGADWNKVMIDPSTRKSVIDRVQHNMLSEWSEVIHQQTAFGEKVLEIGSCTGVMSLQLAQAGREVTLLDFDAASLKFSQGCAAELGISVRTVQGDATQPLPFADEEFDCTWHSGLLEHFTSDERRAMLKEWVRVTSQRVVSLVPNAASLAYRVGKAIQEENGQWPYGLETPLFSLREDFEAVGLEVEQEYSIGPESVLFLPSDHPLRRALETLAATGAPPLEDNCNQGYLLVTIGRKRKT